MDVAKGSSAAQLRRVVGEQVARTIMKIEITYCAA
jgi:hypothetical protein